MRKIRQHGFSMMEILMVLIVISSLVATALIVFPRVRAGKNASDSAYILKAAALQIATFFTSRRYGNLTSEAACHADAFPDEYRMDMGDCTAGFKNQWGGDINAYGSDSDGTPNATIGARHFTLSFELVPAPVCIKLAPALTEFYGFVGIGQNPAEALSLPIYDLYSNPSDEMDETLMVDLCKEDNVTIVMIGY